MNKSDYVMGVGRAGKGLMDALQIALLFWHCKIPYNDACQYIRNYVEARNQGNTNGNTESNLPRP